jgi:hypothetical protein
VTPAALLLVLLIGCAHVPAPAAEALTDAAPAGFAEPQRRDLAPTGIRVLRSGRPLVDFWFRAALPTADPRRGAGIRYGSLVPGSRVGAVRVYEGASDFKGQKIAPGLYTLRYAVQPEDGDHQDVTESRDFLLLCEAAADAAPGDLDEKTLRALSARINGKKHPSVLYLTDLTDGKGGARPLVRTEPSPEKTVLEVDVPTSGGRTLPLAIVVAGRAEE